MPSSSRAAKEGGPQESSPQPQTPVRVCIDSALGSFMLCFNDSDFVLQKICQINYDSDAKELERMMAEVSGDSNPEEGDRVKS